MEQNTTIQWQTGTPKETGKYLITTKYHEVEVDMWFGTPDSYGDHWERHYDEDVLIKCGSVIKCIDAVEFSEYFRKAMEELSRSDI